MQEVPIHCVNKKGKSWTRAEEEVLIQLVESFGLKNWKKISREMKKTFKKRPKTSKQCRDRWINYLDPHNSSEKWTDEEETILFEQHRILNNKWSKIAKHLNGRSGNAVKNHFYGIVRKNIRRFNKGRPQHERVKECVKSVLKSTELYNRFVKSSKLHSHNVEKPEILKEEKSEFDLQSTTISGMDLNNSDTQFQVVSPFEQTINFIDQYNTFYDTCWMAFNPYIYF